MPPSAIHMDHIRSQQAKHLQAASYERQAGETASPKESGSQDSEEGMSFWDVLDVVNPLQHIPGVNKIYQAITGDTIKTPAKIAGAALFFGPIGLALAGADAVVEKETGKDTLDNLASAVGLGQDADAPAEDDPFTVTAPRMARTTDAETVATTAPAARQAVQGQAPTDLSGTQAAALERLMAPGGSTLSTTSASALAPAAGGIATAQELKKLESTPGASAALTAARGMGSSAVMASLPSPGGTGVGDNVLAAMSQDQQAAKSGKTGKGLAEYRAAAVHSGSMIAKPLLPSKAEQVVRNTGSSIPAASASAPLTSNPLLTTRTTQFTGQPANQTNSDLTTASFQHTAQTLAARASAGPAAAETATSQTTAPQALSAGPSNGPTPVPKELVADMMAQAMSKYEAQMRRKGEATSSGVTIN